MMDQGVAVWVSGPSEDMTARVAGAVSERLARRHLPTELLVLALEALTSAQMVDGAILRRRHQPCRGIVRDPRFRPTLQGHRERVLGKLFGEAHVADDACQPGDELGGLDPPDGVDGAMWIGGRHGRQSEQVRFRSARRLRHRFSGRTP